MDSTEIDKRAKQTLSSVFEHDLIVRTVLLFVGPGENIYAAAIGKRWRWVHKAQKVWRV